MSSDDLKISRMIWLTVALLVLEFTWSETALALDPKKAISQYVHDVWQIEDGLPSNTVSGVIQTRDGYIWLTTEGGLVRFDGVKFTVFNSENTEAIRHTHVEGLYEDRERNLWIGTPSGVIQYRNGRFTSYTLDEVDTRGVAVMCEDREENLWVSGGRRGAYRFKDGTFTQVGSSPAGVASIHEDREGNIWMGSSGGVYRLKGGDMTHYDLGSHLNNQVRTIYEDRAGNLWVGTNGGGLNRLKDGVFTHYTTQDGLSNNIVRSIYGDRDGNLWIGTYGGLNRLKDGVFTRYAPKGLWSNRQVRSIYEDRRGNLWVMTMGEGLSRFEGGEFTYYRRENGMGYGYPAILEGQDGSLWNGNQIGLFRLKDGEVVEYSVKDGLSHSYVMSLYEDPEGTLWIGTYGGGLNRFKEGRFTTYGTKEGLHDEVVYAILEDDRGNLWMSGNRGIFRVSKNELNDLAEG